ncbi:MAG: alpha/beta hydrolase [Verrucomicrobiales bacterium]
MDQPIFNPQGERIDYTFRSGAGEAAGEGWLVLLGHGVTGNKDRPLISELAEALNAAGFDTLRFSFAGNGESGGDFREATISKETDDLAAIVDGVSAGYSKIAYIGHSMGGAVGVLQAARDPRIRCLVSIAGMVDTKTFAMTEFGDVEPDSGVMWEDDECPLSSAFMADLCETVGSVAPRVAAVQCPWLLVHGTADDVVRPGDTETVRSLRGDAVDVCVVDGADHSFNEPRHRALVLASVVEWLSGQAVNG